jgi:hypothetical protein
MKLSKLVALATASTVTVGMSLFAVGVTGASAANGVQPVAFDVAAGSLTLAQTPSAGTSLVPGTAVDMPATTITDGRNAFDRTGAWSVTAAASALSEVGGASIAADQITLAQSGTFTAGTGTLDVVPVGLVSASADSIDSVYSYTPTATLAVQSHPYSGAYTGTVTQTVV